MITSRYIGACTAVDANTARPSVEVINLSVEGRLDPPLGIDEANPALGWQFVENSWATSHPGDRQTAYQIQAATSESNLEQNTLIWDSGRVASGVQCGIRYAGRALASRERVVWRVRIWGADQAPSNWSEPSSWEMGLLRAEDWVPARWINYPDRTEDQALPIFARQFTVDDRGNVIRARLYLAGVGMHLATLNGSALADEVLAPGNSNYQLSSEYRTYDLAQFLLTGTNTIGVQIGNGPAYVRRTVTNPAVGRMSPYAWWQSEETGSAVLLADAPVNAASVRLDSVANFHLGGTINIDTGNSGDLLESRTITAIGTAGIDGTGVCFRPGLSTPHLAGAAVTGSGNDVAATDPSAGAAVSPRLIARLEVSYADGQCTVIVSDRTWRSALGPLVTDAWYSGADHDARREQPGWDRPGSNLWDTARRRDGSATSWTNAGIAAPPNLSTKLVARTAETIKIVETFTPVSITNPAPDTWVFDLGQNIVGWPELSLGDGIPAGTTIRISPAESLAPDGTVDQRSLMGGGDRGTDLFNTYVAAGTAGGETWHPNFNYFGMQFVQITGLPDGYLPTTDLITGLRLQAAAPTAGEISTSNPRINRLHTMARNSFASNIMSVFTDCPGREKLSYPADYTMPMGAIHRNYHLAAYLRTTMRHLVEGQSIADTPMFGNVALKTPVYDWGYTGRFGDEINWGNAIILVPWLLYELYGDTGTMARCYDQMVSFANYIQRQKAGTGAEAHIVNAALGDWVAAHQTSGRITGTWGYYVMIRQLASMAHMTGHSTDSDTYLGLATDIRTAFNAHFFNTRLHRYTADGNAGNTGATQTAQALALDAGLVPDEERDAVLNALVELVYAYHPVGDGPHFSGGTIGMAPIVRALSAGGRDDVLWDLLQQNDQPSYGFFLAPTTGNPDGLSTMAERWDLQDSKNHMILAQIEEWFHRGLVGIRAAVGAPAYRALVIQPKVVGDLTAVTGSYHTPHGLARSEWTRTDDRFTLHIGVPTNTTAEVWVPKQGGWIVLAPDRAELLRVEDHQVVFRVGAGSFTFAARPS